jgi:hypothetical protein
MIFRNLATRLNTSFPEEINQVLALEVIYIIFPTVAAAITILEVVFKHNPFKLLRI